MVRRKVQRVRQGPTNTHSHNSQGQGPTQHALAVAIRISLLPVCRHSARVRPAHRCQRRSRHSASCSRVRSPAWPHPRPSRPHAPAASLALPSAAHPAPLWLASLAHRSAMIITPHTLPSHPSCPLAAPRPSSLARIRRMRRPRSVPHPMPAAHSAIASPLL
eukprot:5384436-Prymnesium_polylepis.1